MALNELRITNDTPNPEGGVIGKKDGEPTGYIEEAAFMEYIQ